MRLPPELRAEAEEDDAAFLVAYVQHGGLVFQVAVVSFCPAAHDEVFAGITGNFEHVGCGSEGGVLIAAFSLALGNDLLERAAALEGCGRLGLHAPRQRVVDVHVHANQ